MTSHLIPARPLNMTPGPHVARGSATYHATWASCSDVTVQTPTFAERLAASSPLSPSIRRFSYQSAAHVWAVDNVTFALAQSASSQSSVGVPSWPQARHALCPFSHKSDCAGLEAVALYRQCISPSGADSAFGDITYKELYDCSLEMFRQSPTDDCPRLCKRNVLGRTFVFLRLRVSSPPGTLYQETEPRAPASRS
jgi:hypothetical protein